MKLYSIKHRYPNSVEGWVLRGEDLRTPPGPGGSNGKELPLGAAGLPGFQHFSAIECIFAEQEKGEPELTPFFRM